MLAGNTCSLEVTGVNLDSWLVGEYFEEDSALRRVEAGANSLVIALAILIGVQAPVMVVTCSVLNLVEAVIYLLANLCWSTEIHWSSFYVLNLSCWNVKRICRCEIISIDVHNLVETFLGWVAIQVEVAMVCHVDHSLLIGSCTKFNVKRIVALNCIFSSSSYVAWETILTILRIDGKGY